ncbi:MAG: ABC transporter substrate-binding protein [Pseudomonadota bacterium]
MKKLFTTVAFASLALPAFAETISLEDRNGRMVELDGKPEMVVCLLNRCAEEMAAIGIPIENLAFGEPWTSNVALNPLNYGDAALDRPTVPQEPMDWEKVAALEPDLIIGMTRQLDAAEQIAPTYTLSWDDRDSNEAWFWDARAYAKIFGLEDQVEPQVQATIDRVAAYAALSPKDRSIMVLNLISEDEIGLVNECDFFMSQVAPCIVDPEADLDYVVSMEFILNIDPDVIVIEDYNVEVQGGVGKDEPLLSALADNVLWNELSAVKAGNVHRVPVSQAKPNSLASIEATMDTLMPLAYPEVFPAALTDAEVAAALSN